MRRSIPAIASPAAPGNGACHAIEAHRPARFFQGTAFLGGGAGAVSGDRLVCVGCMFTRLGVVLANSNASAYPREGVDPPVSLQGSNAAGDARSYQVWYRDSDTGFFSSAVLNLTNALTLTWQN